MNRVNIIFKKENFVCYYLISGLYRFYFYFYLSLLANSMSLDFSFDFLFFKFLKVYLCGTAKSSQKSCFFFYTAITYLHLVICFFRELFFLNLKYFIFILLTALHCGKSQNIGDVFEIMVDLLWFFFDVVQYLRKHSDSNWVYEIFFFFLKMVVHTVFFTLMKKLGLKFKQTCNQILIIYKHILLLSVIS